MKMRIAALVVLALSIFAGPQAVAAPVDLGWCSDSVQGAAPCT